MSVKREEAFLRSEWDGDLTSVSKSIKKKKVRVMVSVYYGQIIISVMVGQIINEKDIQLHFALVNKKTRGLGIGSRCVSLFCALCFQKAKRVLVGAEKLEVYNRSTRKYEFMDKEVSPVVRFWRREGFKEISRKKFGDEVHELFHFQMSKTRFQDKQVSVFALTGEIQEALSSREFAKLFPETIIPRVPKIRLNAPWLGDFWVDCSAVPRSG